MAQHTRAVTSAEALEANVVRMPVVPPTRARVDAVVEALGGGPRVVECKVPPRRGSLSREVLAINMVMAGCKPEYAPVLRAAMLALTADAFNLNGVQAT